MYNQPSNSFHTIQFARLFVFVYNFSVMLGFFYKCSLSLIILELIRNKFVVEHHLLRIIYISA